MKKEYPKYKKEVTRKYDIDEILSFSFIICGFGSIIVTMILVSITILMEYYMLGQSHIENAGSGKEIFLVGWIWLISGTISIIRGFFTKRKVRYVPVSKLEE